MCLRGDREGLSSTQKIALSLMGVRNNYEFKVGNKKRSDNRKLWKMPGTYLMTLDECPVIHLTTLQRRHCYKKNSNWGCNFTSKLLNFPLTNKVCQRRCMLICNSQKKLLSPLERNRDIPSDLRQVLRPFHEKTTIQ